MKKMWKKTIGMICAGGLSVMCLAGCGKDAAGSPEIPMQETRQNNAVDEEQINKESDGFMKNDDPQEYEADNNAADDGASGGSGIGEFFNGANLQGDVVEFSDEGFSLSPATIETTEGGGEILSQALPGTESDENNIQITYTDNTVFQIVNFSMSSQSEISREDTDKESIKKQSSVCVFGSCQDTYHWVADKILILRWK